IRQANEIVEKEKFVIPFIIAPCLVARFVVDIQILKKVMASDDNSNLTSLQNKVYKSGRAALRKLKKYAPYQTKTLRLMGEYYWLIGKQKKAYSWWDKAVKKGEKLGAIPDLSRTYFEIGKSLLNPKCNYKEWNGISANEYLEKARTMFEEMDLQWDLDEFEKLKSELSTP
ncbi:MAG: hypothetical protein GY853_00935, partial [PVC group bacterium]|nr:hypothetical protein [PVC group bacterium]